MGIFIQPSHIRRRPSIITPAFVLWAPILIAMILVVLTVFGVIHVRPD